MKSYLFTTEADRGGVMLCDIDEFDEAVEYLCNRFDGVVRVEAGDQSWQLPADQTAAPEQPLQAGPDASDGQAVSPESDLFG